MEEVAEPEGVQPQLPGGLQEDVRVVPDGHLRAVLGHVQPVEVAEVGVQGDDVGLELGLEAEPEAGAVDLGVVVEVVLHLVVLDAGVGQGVEADGRPAQELGVDAELVVGGEVVVEERWSAYTWRAAARGC